VGEVTLIHIPNAATNQTGICLHCGEPFTLAKVQLGKTRIYCSKGRCRKAKQDEDNRMARAKRK
jgi:formylmethanofuran dehydrogenase subunit E